MKRQWNILIIGSWLDGMENSEILQTKHYCASSLQYCCYKFQFKFGNQRRERSNAIMVSFDIWWGSWTKKYFHSSCNRSLLFPSFLPSLIIPIVSGPYLSSNATSSYSSFLFQTDTPSIYLPLCLPFFLTSLTAINHPSCLNYLLPFLPFHSFYPSTNSFFHN